MSCFAAPATHAPINGIGSPLHVIPLTTISAPSFPTGAIQERRLCGCAAPTPTITENGQPPSELSSCRPPRYPRLPDAGVKRKRTSLPKRELEGHASG